MSEIRARFSKIDPATEDLKKAVAQLEERVAALEEQLRPRIVEFQFDTKKLGEAISTAVKKAIHDMPEVVSK